MNGTELAERLTASSLSVYELIEILDDKNVAESDIKNLGETELVYEEGGGEGEGEHVERVVHFKDHNVYLRCTGFYASYDGTTWENDWHEVKPKQVEVTQYEKVA